MCYVLKGKYTGKEAYALAKRVIAKCARLGYFKKPSVQLVIRDSALQSKIRAILGRKIKIGKDKYFPAASLGVPEFDTNLDQLNCTDKKISALLELFSGNKKNSMYISWGGFAWNGNSSVNKYNTLTIYINGGPNFEPKPGVIFRICIWIDTGDDQKVILNNIKKTEHIELKASKFACYG